jgi:hypothetical protein
MKNVLFASAALAVVALAAPAFAQDATGYVGGSYTHGDTEGLETDTWGLNGAVAFDATETLGVQIDAGYANTAFDGFDSDDTYGATAHLFTRNDAWAIGGFAGVSDSDSNTAWTAGVEGAKYLGAVTLAGTVAYANGEESSDDAWGVGGEARYFVSDNFRLNAGLGWAEAEDLNVWSAGLGAEYQTASSPFSIYGGYNHVKFDDVDVESDQFTIGLRYNFGGQTLKGRDRSGASFGGVAGVFGGLF